ncbi:MAG: type II toxin-antitoxin system HicA family toxin [Firmicutes bacterium]|nr:type II toxin-antitoxin system HicA family toxin [Bacillota bacterium]
MNAKELEKILFSDGWAVKNQKGSHRQYIHPTKKGKVTIPFHGKQDIHLSVVKSILKQAGINIEGR